MQEERAEDNFSQPIEDQILAIDRLMRFRAQHQLADNSEITLTSAGEDVVVTPQSGGIISDNNSNTITITGTTTGPGLLQQLPSTSTYQVPISWADLIIDGGTPPTNNISIYTGRAGVIEFDRAIKQEIYGRPITTHTGFFELTTITN